ncbi:molybdopterin-dependent oxidoreductase [Nocardioides pacificus]
MRTPRRLWAASGIVAGLAGLATSYAAARQLSVESPLGAAGDALSFLSPPQLDGRFDALIGTLRTPVIVLVVALVLGAVFGYAGRLASRHWWLAALVHVPLAGLGALAVIALPGTSWYHQLPVLVALVTWLLLQLVLTGPLRRWARALRSAGIDPASPAAPPDAETTSDAETPPDAGTAPDAETTPEQARSLLRAEHHRRGFLVRAGAVTVASTVLSVSAGTWGRGRQLVERKRKLLRIAGVSKPQLPPDVRVGLPGVTPWRTRNEDFFTVQTALVPPSIDPDQWRLRIHGLVEREVVLTYERLLARPMTEAWVTLACVTNEVGGDLVGNAWWSGIPLHVLLAEAGLLPEADAVVQTSQDGWTCQTPLSAIRGVDAAMLAVAMNGEPLPVEHGSPARSVVPGLYGHVSACKWVVDIEVTRFDDMETYWPSRGWAAEAPVKIASRIDVPGNGDELPAGLVRLGGVAWAPRSGIAAVEVTIDGSEWFHAQVAPAPNDDTWVQWAISFDVPAGDHVAVVRGIDKDGNVQTGVETEAQPDGATGWHSIDFTAQEA